jgi:DNA topoisomerase-1
MQRLQNKLNQIGSDSKITAKAVGLRYAGFSEKGFYRFKKGTEFIFKDEKKVVVKDAELIARINKLVIPPAWEHVWISPYANGHLQVIGTDAKGRKQYRYHENWNKIRNQSKFYRLRNFAKALPKIRKQVEKDLKRRGLPYEKVVALVVKLIENTNIRIGNEAYKKLYGSFGLTTLRDKHVQFKGSEITFTFQGKKGVRHHISLKDKKLMNLVKKCKDVPGYELFQFYDDDGKRHSIGSGDVNAYLQEVTKQDFTAKDFRVWSGSVHALCTFLEDEAPENPAQCKKKVIEVLDKVAQKLGNTRAVCKKYYVHPTVLAAAEKGSIWLYKDIKTTNHRNLNPEEKILMQLLENEKIAAVLG